jgi:hypothetical protein
MRRDTRVIHLRLALCCAGLGAAVTPAAADDLFSGLQAPHAVWSAFGGATYTDDATRLANGPSDTIAVAGVGGSLYRDSGRLRADLDGSVHYEDYLHGTYPSHVIGQLQANASYALRPEQVLWVLQDVYGQLNANTLQPSTPQNRINANTFSTGPDAYLNLGGGLALNLGARYSQGDYQSAAAAPLNDRRVTANAGLERRLSSDGRLSLNASGTRVEYREPGAPSYDIREYFARYQARGPRTGVALEAGTTTLTENNARVNDPLLRLTFFRRLSPFWNLNLGAGSEFRNTSSALQGALANRTVVNGQVAPGTVVGDPSRPGAPVVDVNLSRNAFRDTYGRASLGFVARRTSLSFSGGLGRERYQFSTVNLDRNTSNLGVTATRQLRPSLGLHAAVTVVRREPSASLPGDRTNNADLGLDWRSGSLLAWTLAYHREQRSADTGGFAYHENRIYLGFTLGPPKPALTTPGVGPAGGRQLTP